MVWSVMAAADEDGRAKLDALLRDVEVTQDCCRHCCHVTVFVVPLPMANAVDSCQLRLIFSRHGFFSRDGFAFCTPRHTAHHRQRQKATRVEGISLISTSNRNNADNGSRLRYFQSVVERSFLLSSGCA